MIPRTLVDLLTDQIEFANVMVLNKVGAAAPGRLDQARKIIRALDPDAKVIETDDSRIDPVWVFDTSLFDFNRTHEHPLWAKELYGVAHHVPETEEYGVSSFKYRARRPLDPVRIHAVLNGEPKGVIRAQGHFWIATVPIGLPSSVLRVGGPFDSEAARPLVGGRSSGLADNFRQAGCRGIAVAGALGGRASGTCLHRLRHG
jgi:G3E family GTPase